MSIKFLALTDVCAWLEELSGNFTVHVPQAQGSAVVYRPWVKGAAALPELRKKPTESAKHVLFPRSERLFSFRREADLSVTLEEAQKTGPQLIFGMLSCDARGFLGFDPVYGGGNSKGAAADPYYLGRRDEAVLIVRACKNALNTCFCTWVGGDPASRDGADVLVTELDEGMVLEPVTDKGEALMESSLLKAAGAGQINAATALHDQCRAQMAIAGAVPDISTAPAALYSLFENAEFWSGQSAGCLSCGICTYLCPTCYCFNITDEEAGSGGVRMRSWDNCMSYQYTLEASGHNPRPGKAERLRNRIGHKFAYYPRTNEGRFLCSGCGRCIKSCPSSIDIRRIVLDALSEQEAANVKQ